MIAILPVLDVQPFSSEVYLLSSSTPQTMDGFFLSCSSSLGHPLLSFIDLFKPWPTTKCFSLGMAVRTNKFYVFRTVILKISVLMFYFEYDALVSPRVQSADIAFVLPSYF